VNEPNRASYKRNNRFTNEETFIGEGDPRITKPLQHHALPSRTTMVETITKGRRGMILVEAKSYYMTRDGK